MKKPNIGILTFPMAQANIKPSSNFVNIIQALSDTTFIITVYNIKFPIHEDENQEIYKIPHNSGKNPFNRILNYIGTQLKISYKLTKLSKNVDFWIFYMGENAVMPMIIAKVLRKQVILALGGFMEKDIALKKDFIGKILISHKKINVVLSHKIILYSPKLIKEWNLEKHKGKICIAHEHFIDFDKFKIKKRFDERYNLVGYIGRLSEEKGVLNFVQSIPAVLEKENDIKIVIGGDGRLFNEIKEFIDKNELSDKIKLIGWISHDKLPDYLNELKLAILPSHTEGLPNLMLEAMACGTLVLATPVGAIPDIITDGETGFIMEDNSPVCIAENVIRALEHPDLGLIVENARVLVEREFTYEAAVGGYRGILDDL